MLRLKDVPESETSEVIRVAQEMYERETSETLRRNSLVDAAEEMGLPGEYLERATQEVHQRRVVEIQQKRRKRNLLIASTAAVALGIGLMFTGTSTRRAPTLLPPAPITTPRSVEDFNVSPAQSWSLDTDGRSRGTVDYIGEAGRGNVARLRVDSFRPDAQGRYFINLHQTGPPGALSGNRQLSFDARGYGLSRVRLDLENGPLERWRGPALPVGEQWQTLNVRLDQFERQVRSAPGEQWRLAPGRVPESVRRLSFKTGERVNEASARGEVRLDNVRAE